MEPPASVWSKSITSHSTSGTATNPATKPFLHRERMACLVLATGHARALFRPAPFLRNGPEQRGRPAPATHREGSWADASVRLLQSIRPGGIGRAPFRGNLRRGGRKSFARRRSLSRID